METPAKQKPKLFRIQGEGFDEYILAFDATQAISCLHDAALENILKVERLTGREKWAGFRIAPGCIDVNLNSR